MNRTDLRNKMLVRSTSNVLYNWANGTPDDECMQRLKRAFEQFADEPDIDLAYVFARMED